MLVNYWWWWRRIVVTSIVVFYWNVILAASGVGWEFRTPVGCVITFLVLYGYYRDEEQSR